MKKEKREIKTKEAVVVKRYYPQIDQVVEGATLEECNAKALKIMNEVKE